MTRPLARWGGRALVLLALFSLDGCTSYIAYERGLVVPLEEAAERADSLSEFVEEEIQAGNVDRAYYLYQLMRLRRFAADAITQSKTNLPSEYEDIWEFLKLRAAVHDEENRPDAATRARYEKLAASMRRAGATDERAFWLALLATERRLKAYSEQGNPYERPYASIFEHVYIPASTRDVRMALAPDEVALEYFFAEGGVYCFVTTSGGTTVRTLELTRARVQGLVKDLRGAIAAYMDATKTIAEQRAQETTWQGPARQLDQALLEPFADVLRGAKVLFLVAHGPLKNLPFAALLDGSGTPLLVRHRIVFQPAMSVYKEVSSRSLRRQPPKLLVVEAGDAFLVSRMGPYLGRLFPDTTRLRVPDPRETKAMRERGWELPVEPATEPAVVRALAEHNMVIFYSHGNLFDDVPLAANLSLWGVQGRADGKLTAAEIRGLNVSHMQLVMMNACQSALSGDGASDDDVMNLAAAWLVAGSPAVIGTLWSVSQASASTLDFNFFERFLEAGPGEALRQACLAVRDDPRYAHPFHWAPYIVAGLDR